jgi:hypothetical protein
VLERGAGRFAVIFEQENVAESAVVLQIQHAIAIGPENFLDGFLGHAGQREVVIRRFDDYFVRADAVHAVEKSIAFAIQAAFDAQRRKFIGHYAERPTRRVFTAAIPAVSKNFTRRLTFVTGAERTIRVALDDNALANKIHRAIGPVCGNDYPTSRDGISAKLWQTCPPVLRMAFDAIVRNSPCAMIILYYSERAQAI